MNALMLTTDLELKTKLQQLCAAMSPPITLLPDMPGMLRLDPVAIAVPDLVFFDARGEQREVLASLERVSARHPEAMIVLLVPEQSPDLLIAAMRIGVREVVSFPIDFAELEMAVERVIQKRNEKVRAEGKVIAVISSKGGSGTTFVAVNTAYALASVAHKKTLLIDLNLQYGDAALFISDVKSPATLTDLCAQIHRLDAQLLDSSVIRAAPNFDLIAAASDPDPEDKIKPDHIAALLAVARRQYDFILLDMGRQVNAVSIRALDGSDLIFPVLQQSLPFIRSGQRMLDMFSTLGYRKESIRQILNRYDESGAVTQADMERGLGQRIAFQIPNNFAIASESINQGEPVLKIARSSAIAKGFNNIVNALTKTHESSPHSLIRRLFTRGTSLTH
jgi:pilus assembly protein CpaE